MRNKKSDQPEKPAELQELESRVDAMMSTEPAKKKPVKASAAAVKTGSLRVISDYDDSRKTAPELSPKPGKNVKTAESAGPEPSPEPSPKESMPEEPVSEPPTPEVPPAGEPEPAEAEPAKSMLEDAEIDKAVDDIVVHEGDTQLAVDDAIAERRSAEAEMANRQGLVGRFFTSYWTWIFIVGIAGVTYAWFH